MSISWMNSRNSVFSAPINNMNRESSFNPPINNMNRELRDDNGTYAVNINYKPEIQDLKRRPMMDQDIGGFNARRIKKINIEMPSGNGYDAYNNTYNGSGYVNRPFEEEL